jgi:hypothetical protein
MWGNQQFSLMFDAECVDSREKRDVMLLMIRNKAFKAIFMRKFVFLL